MKTRYLLPALLLGSALAGSPALADPDNHGGGGGGSMHAAAPNSHWGGGHWNGSGHWSGGRWHGGRWNGHWGGRFAANRAAFHFSTRDVSHFNTAEMARWRGGHWWHGRHDGHFGWWWGFNGGFFFYDAPIYPYPGYVSDDFYYDDGGYDNGPGYGGDDEDSGPGDNGPGPQGYSGGPDAGSWYYCHKPEGYYPYVRTCHGDWERVPAQPEGYNGGSDDRGGPPRMGHANGPPADLDRGGPPPDDNDNDDQDDGPPPPPHH